MITKAIKQGLTFAVVMAFLVGCSSSDKNKKAVVAPVATPVAVAPVAPFPSTHMMENPQTIGQSAHLLFVAKNLERVGDHATNIAEMVYYAATGNYLAERDDPTPP